MELEKRTSQHHELLLTRRPSRPRLFWLSDEAWAKLDPYLPHGKPGKPRVDDRRVLSSLLHVLKTGCRWRDVPPEYGPATTVYNRWSQRGVWQRMFERMAASGEVPAELMLDSTHVKAHRSASGAKGGMGTSDRRLARRPHVQSLSPSRCLTPTGRVRPDA